MGILRSTVKFDCKASQDLERAYTNIPVKDDCKPLYSEKQKGYHRYLRKQPSDLKDREGFYSYFQEFTRKLGVLDRAGARPSDAELMEWVKSGIQNDIVNNFMAAAVITTSDPNPT